MTTNDIPDHDLLLPAEVADLLDTSRSTIYRWAAEGLLKSIRIGNTIRLRRADVDRVLAEEENIKATFLLPEEAADLLDTSRSSVRRWVTEGLLPAARIGNMIRIRRVDVEDLLREEGHDGET